MPRPFQLTSTSSLKAFQTRLAIIVRIAVSLALAEGKRAAGISVVALDGKRGTAAAAAAAASIVGVIAVVDPRAARAAAARHRFCASFNVWVGLVRVPMGDSVTE